MGLTVLFVIFCLVFGVFWSFDSLLLLLLALFICVFVDMYNYIKRLFFICFYKVRRRFSPKKLTDANGFKVICLPPDVDLNMHLTESRLLQECTFALTKFWTENFLYDALYSRQATMHIAGRYIRYKHQIKLFESFEIISHVMSWDESTFYVSQSVLRYTDKYLCATVLSVHHIAGTSMSTLLGGKDKYVDFRKHDFENVTQTFNEFHTTYLKKSQIHMEKCVKIIKTGVLWMWNEFLCIVIGLCICLNFDVHAIWRNVLVLYFCKMRRKYKPKKLMDTNILQVICLPIDVDNCLQLTTGRLLRECGFGQTEFWVENFVHDALASLKGKMKVEAYHVSYDVPIKIFETFKIIAKIVYWDDTAFYMKQTVMRNRDHKECATILSTHRLTGVTTSQVLNVLEKDRVPNKPVLSNLVKKLQEINMDISKKL